MKELTLDSEPVLLREAIPTHISYKTLAKAGLVFGISVGTFALARASGVLSWAAGLWSSSAASVDSAVQLAHPSQTPIASGIFSTNLASRNDWNPELPEVQGFFQSQIENVDFQALSLSTSGGFRDFDQKNTEVFKSSPKAVTELLVNMDASSDQKRYPSVAALANGGFVVAWQSLGQDGDGDGIYARKYDGTGAAVTDELLINTNTVHHQTTATVAGLADGGMVVAWTSDNQGSSSYDVYYRRYDALNAVLTNDVLVNVHTDGFQEHNSISALKNGGFVVVWESLGQDGSGYGVYGRQYDSENTALNDGFLINQNTTNHQQTPTVAALSNGGFVAVWQSLGQDGSGYGIYGRQYNAAGAAVTNEFLINTHTTNDQINPAVAALSSGGFIAVWQSLDQDGSYGVYGRQYNAAVVPVSDEFLVDINTSGNQDSPAVTGSAGGGFIMAWQSFAPNGSSYEIYGRQYNVSSIAVTDEFLVNTHTANDQLYPAIASLINGGFVVAWQSNAQDGSGQSIYARLYDPSPSPSCSPSVSGSITSSGTRTPSATPSASISISMSGLPSNSVSVTYTPSHTASISVTFSPSPSPSASNNPPVLNIATTTFVYTEGQGSLAIDPTLTLFDPESTQMSEALIKFSSGYINGEDVLTYTDQNGITGNFEESTGALTFSGIATVVQYRNVLRKVCYFNTSQNPSSGIRTVEFVVTDSGAAESTARARSFSVQPINDAPVVSISASTFNYMSDGKAQVIDANLVLSDADSSQLSNATVSFDSGYSAGEDHLLFTSSNSITESFDAIMGILKLAGVATLAQYQNALRSVQYKNTNSSKPSTEVRSIGFTVADQEGAVSKSVFMQISIQLTATATPTPTPTLTTSSTKNNVAVKIAASAAGAVAGGIIGIGFWKYRQYIDIKKEWNDCGDPFANKLREALNLSLGSPKAERGVDYLRIIRLLEQELNANDITVWKEQNGHKIFISSSNREELVKQVKNAIAAGNRLPLTRKKYSCIPGRLTNQSPRNRMDLDGRLAYDLSAVQKIVNAVIDLRRSAIEMQSLLSTASDAHRNSGNNVPAQPDVARIDTEELSDMDSHVTVEINQDTSGREVSNQDFKRIRPAA